MSSSVDTWKTLLLSTASSLRNCQSSVDSKQQFLDTWATVSLSTASSLGNCQSSVDSKQQFLDTWTTKNFTSTTSSVAFFSSSEESSLGKFSPRILAEIFPVHRGILGGKFSLTDSVGQCVLYPAPPQGYVIKRVFEKGMQLDALWDHAFWQELCK